VQINHPSDHIRITDLEIRVL